MQGLGLIAISVGLTFVAGLIPSRIAAKKDPQPPWLADAPAAVGHPDEKDVKNVVRLLEKMDLP